MIRRPIYRILLINYRITNTGRETLGKPRRPVSHAGHPHPGGVRSSHCAYSTGFSPPKKIFSCFFILFFVRLTATGRNSGDQSGAPPALGIGDLVKNHRFKNNWLLETSMKK